MAITTAKAIGAGFRPEKDSIGAAATIVQHPLVPFWTKSSREQEDENGRAGVSTVVQGTEVDFLNRHAETLVTTVLRRIPVNEWLFWWEKQYSIQ